MSYTDRKEMTASRFWSLVLVFALHGLLLYWMMNGGYQQAKKKLADLNVIDIKEPPPPPPEKPLPPPPKENLPPPPVVSPPPIVQTNVAPPPQMTTVSTPPPVFVPTPEPPRPAPPPPPPPPIVKLTPRGSPQSWVTNDDYPPAAIRAEEQGAVGYTLQIGADGRVTSCNITGSTGSSTLDDATCKLLTRRARFNPGKDENGNATGGTYSGRFRWVLPTD